MAALSRASDDRRLRARRPDARRPRRRRFVVELTAFSGPLDLLLSLIREEQVDIYDIPIARICEQFVVRIRTLGLNEAAEYLEMAARLLRIKAQMLLPRSDDEAWEDPRAELVRRLLEYQQMREVVDVLERRGEERRNQFARAYLPQAPAPPQAPLALSLSELLSAVDRVLRAARQPNMHEVIPRAIDIPGAITIIRSVLALRARILWTEIVETQRRTVADSLDAPRPARAREARRAASRSAQTICQRGNLS